MSNARRSALTILNATEDFAAATAVFRTIRGRSGASIGFGAPKPVSPTIQRIATGFCEFVWANAADDAAAKMLKSRKNVRFTYGLTSAAGRSRDGLEIPGFAFPCVTRDCLFG